ncbi:MAG: nucleotide exchange factor GrpE [Deltaproteobacteria bacterium]|nr:nucleotide exchange factor GrpE [Deltaproteobacteria bacterium]
MNEIMIDRPFDVDEQASDGDGKSNANTDDAKAQTSDDAGAAAKVSDTSEFEVPEDADDPEARVAALEARLQETNERLLRVAADFENYRKRIEREKGDYLKYANERLMRDLLNIVDNLQRALDSAKTSGDSEAITHGIGLVYQDILKVLDKFGVKLMEAKDKPFDPMFHEALQTAETDEVAPGTILEEVQRGYMMHEKVLRPALVVVSASPEETSPGVDIPSEIAKDSDK